MCYLKGKLEKYVGSSDVRSYVELVRNRTQAKVAAATMTVEQVEVMTVEAAAVKASLEEKEKQLWESELECATL